MDKQLQVKDGEVLVDRVHEALKLANRPSLRNVSVQIEQQNVVLLGMVQSWHEKQIATSYCQSVPGVQDVVNQLEVNDN